MLGLARRSIFVGVAGVLALVLSHVLVYQLGPGRADAGETAPPPAEEPASSWCESGSIAIERLEQIGTAPGAIAEGVAALDELRSAAPDLAADLGVLIDAYTALDEGDLAAVSDQETAAAIDTAASQVTSALERDCGLVSPAPSDG